MAIDIDYVARKFRRPKIETPEEVLQRMQAVELAVKEALLARGEKRFTDQEFPPCDQSLFVDTENPCAKLQVIKPVSRFTYNLELVSPGTCLNTCDTA